MGDDFRSKYLDNNQVTDPYTCTGIFRTIVSSRLSYQLNLLGPNMVIDTACSSSAIAIHLACQGLKAGICSFTPSQIPLSLSVCLSVLSLSRSLAHTSPFIQLTSFDVSFNHEKHLQQMYTLPSK